MPGSNAVKCAHDVRAQLDQLKATFPPDVKTFVALDTTKAVTAGIHDIVVTLFISLALVIIVVYIFLQGWRSTLIPLVAVPVSLVGTFAAFPLLGFSINTLSLFAMVLAVGLVVDDAIVVVEAVEKQIEEGMTPRDAAFAAMEQVSSPVIAIALILTAVFLPTAFIPGITGRLYQQFAITIAISVVLSAFNALTLSPALCALLLKPKEESKGLLGKFFAWFNRIFARATEGYVSTSGWLVRKAGVAVIILIAFSAGVVLLGAKLPGGFLPEEDQGYAFAALQLPQGSSLKRTTEAAASVEKEIKKVPGVEYVTSVAGFSLLSTTQDTYNGFFFITLKDWDQRKSKQERFKAITQNLQKQLSSIPQGLAFAFPPPAIPGLGNSGGVSMVLEDRTGAKDPSFLNQNTFKFLAALHGHPEIAQAVPTFFPNVPQLYVDVDKEKVLQQQVSLSDVYTAMQTFMGGYLVNYFNRFGRQWQTYIEAEGESRKNIENIGQFYVTASNGSPVPLSALTSVRRTTGPEFTTRFNEYEAAQITIIGAPGNTTAQVMKVVEQVFAQTMPTGMGMDYSGMSFQEQQAQKGIPTWVIFAISILFCFLILSAQYESWSLPFGVLLSTPIAIFGAYLTLMMRHLENNVYAQIGLVMLIGLSAKNAILIVEFAKNEYEKGETIFDAAMNAAKIRFRPILMTAFAFILGCLPLWFASGSGGVSRQILGTIVIGGMIMATLVAILMIPVTYSLAERISNKIGKVHDGSLEVKGSKDPQQYEGPSQTLADLEKKKAKDKPHSQKPEPAFSQVRNS